MSQRRRPITSTTSFPRNRLPGYYKWHGARFTVNKRLATMINEFGGRLILYRDLPVECQHAIAHYMAVDGEAWTAPESVYEESRKAFAVMRSDGCYKPDMFNGVGQELRKCIPHMVDTYGHKEFGYIEKLPVLTLIKSAMADAVVREDWPASDSWNEYHDWFMSRTLKHSAESDLWPVIMSSFDDETLQDGWNRFHQYADRRLEFCRAIFYPRDRRVWKERRRISIQDGHRRQRK